MNKKCVGVDGNLSRSWISLEFMLSTFDDSLDYFVLQIWNNLQAASRAETSVVLL